MSASPLLQKSQKNRDYFKDVVTKEEITTWFWLPSAIYKGHVWSSQMVEQLPLYMSLKQNLTQQIEQESFILSFFCFIDYTVEFTTLPTNYILNFVYGQKNNCRNGVYATEIHHVCIELHRLCVLNINRLFSLCFTETDPSRRQ